MRAPALILIRVLAETALLPVRLAAGIAGMALAIGGALGAIAWTIQLMIGGSGGGPLPPGLMWLASIGAVPAGVMLLAVATAGVIADSPAQQAQRGSRANARPAPKRSEQLAPDIVDPAAASWSAGSPPTSSTSTSPHSRTSPDLEPVNPTARAAYHLPAPPPWRIQTSRRPL